MRAWSGDSREDDVMGPTVPSASVKTITSPPPIKNGNELRERGYLIAVGSKTARFRKKHQDRIVLTILIFLIILLLILGITMTALYLKSISKAKNLCESRECLRAAANLAESMDRSADPCEDFYRYTCGNWGLVHPSPDSDTHNWFNEKQQTVYAMIRDFLSKDSSGQPKPVQQAMHMYNACIDIEKSDKLGLKPIFEMLETLGLPSTPTYLNATENFDYDAYKFDWLDAVIKIKIKLGMDVLIGFDIISNPGNLSSYSLIMGSPETKNPFPSFLNKNKKQRHVRNSYNGLLNNIISDKFISKVEQDKDDEKSERLYRLYYAEIMKRMFVESGGSTVTNLSEVELDTNIILAANEYVAMYKLDLESDNSTAYEDEDLLDLPENLYTADELQKITDEALEAKGKEPLSIWKRYLTEVFNISEIVLDYDHDKIIVYDLDLDYLINVAALIADTPPVILELFIWAQVVDVMVVHTTSEIQVLYQRFYDEIHETLGAGVPARSLQCACAVDEMLGMAVAYGFVNNSIINVDKPKIQIMLNEIKNSLSRLVDKAEWMDDNTKVATYEKINNMKTLIGYPDWFEVEGKLDAYYYGLELDNETHLENMINIIQVRIKKAFNKFRQSPDYTWATGPTRVNAFHIYQENAITIPLAILQFPFYNSGLESLNYGQIGTIVGHEISHGFDNLGRRFNKDGYLLQWWTNDSISSFENATKCFIDQYSAYYLPEVNKHVDGKQTLGENIADNGGLREAFGALKEHLHKYGREKKLPGFEEMTSEQLFFLSYGNSWCGTSTKESLESELDDSHTPTSLRARGTLQNMKEFATAWKCKPGSAMNPNKRCVIF